MIQLEDRFIDRTGTPKAHRYLIAKALERKFTILVVNDSDLLFKGDNYDELIEHCESVDDCFLAFFEGEAAKGWARIIHDYAESYTINDYFSTATWIEEVYKEFSERVDR